MQSFVISSLLLFLSAFPVYAKEPLRVIEGVVTKVSDGDTIEVTDPLRTKVKIRLYGIDAPETEKRNRKTGRVGKLGQPYGEEALNALAWLIGGKRVTAQVMDIDRYRRAVSLVKIGNRNVNEDMVREGYAWAYRQYLDRPYASQYIQAEEEARRERRGLWRQNNPQPPWEFRQMLKGR